VQRLGVVTRKTSPDFLMVVNLLSPDGSLDRGYMSNYALTQVRDRLARLDGVGDVQLFGAAIMRCGSGSIPAAPPRAT
jgi:multidrug efflux pump subunit AcrB